jgi:very-short-patch-repair endonuclease
VIEIDGRLYHTGTEVFETDRWRQNLLILNGWFVLRFTWTMIEEQPEKVIAMVRESNQDADGLGILNNCTASVGRASSAKERA